MVSNLLKAEVDEPQHIDRRMRSSDNAKINKLLNDFAEQAKTDGIWFSKEAEALSDSNLSIMIVDTIRIALQHARGSCIETTAPRNRFIKIRGRSIQNKLFIKILYSCEERKICYFAGDILKVKERVEDADGYMKQQLEKDVGVIKIAVPIGN